MSTLFDNDYYDEDDYIEHHGIKGQKWGVRNGPPYPIAPSDHSSSERKAGWRSSLEGGANRLKKEASGGIKRLKRATKGGANRLKKKAKSTVRDAEKKVKGTKRNIEKTVNDIRKNGLNDEQKAAVKKAVKIGAAVAGTALVAYGAYKIGNRNGAIDRVVKNGRDIIERKLAYAKVNASHEIPLAKVRAREALKSAGRRLDKATGYIRGNEARGVASLGARVKGAGVRAGRAMGNAASTAKSKANYATAYARGYTKSMAKQARNAAERKVAYARNAYSHNAPLARIQAREAAAAAGRRVRGVASRVQGAAVRTGRNLKTSARVNAAAAGAYANTFANTLASRRRRRRAASFYRDL